MPASEFESDVHQIPVLSTTFASHAMPGVPPPSRWDLAARSVPESCGAAHALSSAAVPLEDGVARTFLQRIAREAQARVIQEAQTDEEIATLKKKIDICFKTKRPNLVQAINLISLQQYLFH